MSFILDRLLKLVGGERYTAPGNAGFPTGSPSSQFGYGSPFSVQLNGKTISQTGAIRGEPPTEYKGTGKNVRALGFQQHPVVHACIRVVSDITSSIPFQVYKKFGKRHILLPKHELQKLLDYPSLTSSAKSLRSNFATDFQIYGNSFWKLSRPEYAYGSLPPLPTGISRINPEGVQVVYVDADMNILSYVIQDHFGKVHSYDSIDIIHFKDLDASDPARPDVFGYPRAAAALVSISSDTEATRYTRQIVGNDGTPTLAVILNDELGEEEAESLRERWYATSVERGRRGRAGFFNGVRDIKPIGFTLQNLEFPDLRRVNREDICAVFGVDPRMVGIASASNDGGLSGAQYVEARSRLVQHTIEPLLYVIEDQLNLWLAPEYGDVYISFDRDALKDLIEDDAATSTRVINEFNAGLRSWESSREMLGMSPDPELTESFKSSTGSMLVPAALMVMSPEEPMPAATTPAPAPAAEVEEPEDEEEEDEDEEERNELTRAIRSGRRVFKRSIRLNKEQRTLLWNQFDERATKEEAEYARAARRLFAEERADVAEIFDEEGANRASEDDAFIAAALRKIRENYRPGGKYHTRWLESYRGIIGKTYRTGGQAVASDFGFAFNASNPRVQTAIERRVKKLADYVTDTSSRQIASAVSAGRKSGMGIGQIANLVNKAVFGGMAESRSQLIARTETVGALNEGEFDTAKDSGVMAEKEWLTQGDDRVRPAHEDLDEERIPIGESFGNGLMYPGDQAGDADEVINCRCTLLYYDG